MQEMVRQIDSHKEEQKNYLESVLGKKAGWGRSQRQELGVSWVDQTCKVQEEGLLIFEQLAED